MVELSECTAAERESILALWRCGLSVEQTATKAREVLRTHNKSTEVMRVEVKGEPHNVAAQVEETGGEAGR